MSQFRLPIVAILTFGSAGMTFVAVALALYFGFSSAIENTRGLFYQQAEQVIDGLIKDIGHEIEPVKQHADQLARRVLNGELDPKNEAQWAAVVSELPATLPQVTGAAFIGLDLQARLYGAPGEPVQYRDFAMFPRATRLLESARKIRTVGVLRPLWSPILNKVIVAISVPLYVQDRLIGIHVAVIGLEDLSARIAAAFEGKHTPFVIYDNNWLLVHPSISGWTPSSESIAADRTFAGATDAALLPDLESLEGEKIGFFLESQEGACSG